ncbi:thiamine-phosphate kinase [Desulfovirgula thermocuniculi]|uniref:thiamine-phosphate kinase n=1 Tax=Desulfovirgula thermocuniculi TaxID=348842 RepID=UPI000404A188|nr:thiamine-phosphate kinase [Desulfovirgula thermocuniculi]
MRLSEIGEFGLIARVAQGLLTHPGEVVAGAGDDAAVLRLPGPHWLLFTTDMLVEGVHFSLAWATYEQVGYKTVAVNASDIAAMGGWPTHGVISLGLPPRVSVEEVEALYHGLRRAAAEYRLNIVGGDTVASPERLVINFALLGLVEAGLAVLRGGARVGDLICVTGTLGNSAAGLYLCQNPGLAPDGETAAFLYRAHLEPRAKLAAGRLLASAGATAMEDVSDGLARELHNICRASGVGCLVRAKDVPLSSQARELARLAGCDPLEWALSGGEDYELVFTLPEDLFEQAKEELAAIGESCTCIGEIIPPQEGLLLELPDGKRVPLALQGYDHFA